MGQQAPVEIVRDPAVHEEPHVEGTRITVRQIRTLVEEEGLDARTVADRYSLDVAAVYGALAYYHANPEEMAEVERQREEAIEAHGEDAVTGPEDL